MTQFDRSTKTPLSAQEIIAKMRGLEGKFDKNDPEAMKRTLKRGIGRIFDRNHRIRPGFSYSWVVPNPPDDAEKIIEYKVAESTVTLYEVPNTTETLYHLTPFEYELPIEHQALIDAAKAELTEHYPKTLQFSRPDQARSYVVRQGIKTITQLAIKRGIRLGATRSMELDYIKRLADVLAKYTAGFGISETFLKDPYIQDIYIDAPASETPVYCTVGGIGDPRVHNKCITNVILGAGDAESLLSRFRYESGRPFSEAMPYLECDLSQFSTRVTVIGKPVSPDGIAIALRRRSSDPWTLLRLISYKSLSALAAGLISFFIDGNSTMLVAGSRGAGKSSLLGAIMLEFPQSQRILTIEDTLELPGHEMKKLGYKLQPMLVQSSLGGLGELTADDALRLSLRLGESAIVLGEVRGKETKTLYEAMRAGTAGSSVLGTIHGNSAKAVYERVVHDMGISAKSFGATDIIIIAGLRRPGGSQKMMRRVTQITEVVKEGGEEGVFQDLMVYNESVDSLVETEFFRHSERIGSIARAWGMTMDEAIQNIKSRASIREKMVQFAFQHNNPSILSARWVAAANNAYWGVIDKKNKMKGMDYTQVVNEWESWFKKNVRYV